VEWSHFSQVYTLLVLLVQFVIDELKDNKIITEGPVDLLCDFINPFVQNGLSRMASQYSISSLAVFGDGVAVSIF
jgi:hypothetical protein